VCIIGSLNQSLPRLPYLRHVLDETRTPQRLRGAKCEKARPSRNDRIWGAGDQECCIEGKICSQGLSKVTLLPQRKRFKSVQLSPIKRLAPKPYASKARDHNFLPQSAGHAMGVPHPGRVGKSHLLRHRRATSAREYDQQIALPLQLVCTQLKCTSLRITIETRPMRNSWHNAIDITGHTRQLHP
jgi:hypothetical protein